MRRILLLSVLLSCLLGCTAQEEMLWKSDIEFLKQELPVLHKDFEKLIDPDSFAQALDRVVEQLPELDDFQVVMEIQRVLARLGVAHTGIPFYFAKPIKRLPLYLEYFDDGLFITALSYDEKGWTGSKVNGIGGFPLDTVHAAIRDIISHENEQWVREMVPVVMRMPQVLYHLGFTSNPDSILFNLEGKADLHAGPEPDWSMMSGKTGLSMPWIQYQIKAYWFEVREDGTLRIVYNKCLNEDSYPFIQLCNEVQKALSKGTIDRVLVDLRWNEGGNSRVFKPLLPVLKDYPDIPVYGAISGRTYSSGLFAARDLAVELNAPLLGSPTGGSPNSYGESRSLMLPSNKVLVKYCVKYFSWPDYQGNTMEPDVPIPFTSKDYFAGRDPVLEYLGQK